MGRRAAAAALGAGLLLAAGCASAPPAETETDATAAGGGAAVAAPVPPLPAGDGEGVNAAAPEGPATEAPDDAEAAAAATPATAATGSEPPPRRPPASEPVRRQLIVIDQGSSEVRPEPGELARTTRRDAAASPGAAPRVTNDNLADYARRGRVTMSGSAAAPPGDPAAAEAAGEGEEAAAAAGGEAPRDEAWWRAQAREIREEWRRTVDEIGELEKTAADLRWRFYAEDDPWVRDGQVKPEWDRALDRLSGARRRLDGYPRRLEALTEEGRRDGALPGWLREGVELEPRPEELPGAEPDPAEPVEPRPVDDDPGSGR